MADVTVSNTIISQLLRDEISKCMADGSPLLRVLSSRGRIRPGKGFGVHGVHDGYADGAFNVDAGGSLATFTTDPTEKYSLAWGRVAEAKQIQTTVLNAAASNGSPADSADQFMVQLKKAVSGVAKKINKQLFTGDGSSSSLVGLEDAISSTGTYAGLNRGTVTTWRSHEFSASGPISIAKMRKDINAIGGKGAYKVKPNLIVTSFEVLEALCAIGDDKVHFNAEMTRPLDSLGFSWGTDYVVVNGVPVMADDDCGASEMFYLNTNELELVYLPPTAAAGGMPLVQATDGVEDLSLPLALYNLPVQTLNRAFAVVAELAFICHAPMSCGVRNNITF